MRPSILWYQARKTRVAGLLMLWHTEALGVFICEEEAPCASLCCLVLVCRILFLRGFRYKTPNCNLQVSGGAAVDFPAAFWSLIGGSQLLNQVKRCQIDLKLVRAGRCDLTILIKVPF